MSAAGSIAADLALGLANYSRSTTADLRAHPGSIAADLTGRAEQIVDLMRESAAHIRDVIPPVIPKGLPEFAPNLLLTLLMAAVIAGALFIPMKMSWQRLALWLAAILLPLAYTWTASAAAGTPGVTIGNLPWDLLAPSGPNYEVLYNIELLIPAGAAAFLWPAGPRRAAALVCAMALPPMIELGQLTFPHLGRACQLGDVMNNELGVIIGWCAAAGMVAAWRSFVPAVQPRHAPSSGRGYSVSTDDPVAVAANGTPPTLHGWPPGARTVSGRAPSGPHTQPRHRP